MKHGTLALGAAAVIVASGCFLWLEGRTPSPMVKSSLVSKETTSSIDALRRTPLPTPQSKLSGDSKVRPETEPREDLPPHLADMEKEEGRALRSSDEEAAYHERLAQEESIVASLAILRKRGPYSEREERLRMLALSHLGRAIQVAEGEALETALNGLEDLALANNLVGVNPDLKKSLAGDKVEAFALLWRHAPARAAKVRKLARGTGLGPLIEFAAARESPPQNHVVAQESEAGSF